MTIGSRFTLMTVNDFAKISDGQFVMGAKNSPHPEDGEGPVRTIYLSGYNISKTAVSNTEFSAFAQSTGYLTTAEHNNGSDVFQGQLSDPDAHPIISLNAPWWRWVKTANWRLPDGMNDALGELPVVHVSHQDAMAYCNWKGARLPTEAEWERAAGLQTGVVSHIWQGDFPDNPTSKPTPRSVSDGEANEFGLIHACGNVWEWTADRFTRLHSPRPGKNPNGPLNGNHYVVKGGSFLCSPSYCDRFRPSSRRQEQPDATTSHLGFRIIKDSAKGFT